LADFNAVYRKRGCPELGRTSDNRGIAGKSETFTRNEHGHIHFAVAIFIMVKCDGVGAGGNAAKGNTGGRSCRHAGAETFGILTTVGEEFRVGRYTNENIALRAA